MKDIQKIKEFFSKPIKEGNEEYYKPKIRKDKNNPNFLYIDIAYPADSGFTTALGSKTMSGRDREEGAAKALSVGNAVAKKLETKYNIEDIDVSDGKNGKVTVFAVSDDFIKMASPSLNEAKEEDKVDTITMDVPLFIRMLEYSKEDAAEDMDLHDVTEKAISLGKERGILQMEDYDEIVGAAENAPKSEMNEDEGIKVGDIVSKKYASTDEDYTKEFKVINITGMSATLQDTKTGKKVGIFLNDLTKSPMKEATTDYSKRRQAQDDYATNKKDKPSKPYNPTPSGKTDYMKRRQKEIAEAIIAKLKK